jgi:hypothetical protein
VLLAGQSCANVCFVLFRVVVLVLFRGNGQESSCMCGEHFALCFFVFFSTCSVRFCVLSVCVFARLSTTIPKPCCGRISMCVVVVLCLMLFVYTVLCSRYVCLCFCGFLCLFCCGFCRWNFVVFHVVFDHNDGVCVVVFLLFLLLLFVVLLRLDVMASV